MYFIRPHYFSWISKNGHSCPIWDLLLILTSEWLLSHAVRLKDILLYDVYSNVDEYIVSYIETDLNP